MAQAPPPQLIRRLARTDQPGEYLLVKLERRGTSAKNPLDLKIIGTDQEHLYHGTLAPDSLASLQAPNYSGDAAQWREIVQYALLQQRPATLADSDPLPEHLQNLELVASIKSSTATLTLRKTVPGSGLTQRLGEFALQEDDEREEVAAFEWVDVAVARADALRAERTELQAATAAQRVEIATLTAQLDDLVAAKKAHEEELLSKFAALLNAKKLKIRELQHVLAARDGQGDVGAEATKEEEPEEEPPTAGKGSRRRAPATATARKPRGGKRKAKQPADEDSDEEMFEAPAAAAPAASNTSGEDDEEDEEEGLAAVTPEPSDDDEETEDDEDAGGVESRPRLPSASTGDAGGGGGGVDEDASSAPKKVKEPPPRRALPFNKKPAKKAESTPPPQSQSQSQPTTRSTRAAATAAAATKSNNDDDNDDDESTTDDEL